MYIHMKIYRLLCVCMCVCVFIKPPLVITATIIIPIKIFLKGITTKLKYNDKQKSG